MENTNFPKQLQERKTASSLNKTKVCQATVLTVTLPLWATVALS